MRKRLTRIGNSWGVILPKEVLDLLDIDDEVELEVVGNTLMLAPSDIEPSEIEASLAYLASKRERAAVYQRLAE
ncbi:MAG: AbrB/MazE/SpoVT family DNA-binding domain-containing protein [Actinomycetota bacterium]